jgi:hypothetical protein
MKTTVIGDVTPCNLVYIYHVLEEPAASIFKCVPLKFHTIPISSVIAQFIGLSSPAYFILKMDAGSLFERLVNIYRMIQHHILEDSAHSV